MKLRVRSEKGLVRKVFPEQVLSFKTWLHLKFMKSFLFESFFQNMVIFLQDYYKRSKNKPKKEVEEKETTKKPRRGLGSGMYSAY